MRIPAILLTFLGALLAPFYPPASAAAELSVFAHVPEASAEGYVVIYSLEPPTQGAFRDGAAAPYIIDQSETAPDFDRVAYYLKLENGVGTKWIYVSMEAFTNDPSALGLPHNVDNPVVHQRNVRNMNVLSNVTGIATGTFLDTGHIEMWPSDYSPEDSYGVFAASDSLYDWGDSGASSAPGYGSFQIHNTMARQTLLAYNGWGADWGSADDLGIGNQPSDHPDWTFAQNADQYQTRKLVILVRPKTYDISFDALPRDRQLFSRDPATNRATVTIAGAESAGGYDQVRLRVLRNGALFAEETQSLNYANGRAPFHFAPKIVAELAAYDFQVLLGRSGQWTTVERVRDVVAGDAYLFYGQSNATAMSYDDTGRTANEYASPWLRTFGQNGDSGSHARNILYWAEAEGDGGETDPASIGQWAMVMGAKLIETHQIPVAILNGARGGYRIDRLQKDRANPDALDDHGSRRRPYNRLRYRALQAEIAESVRALFYYQGEHDSFDAQAHADGFAHLREDWAVDYPAIERFYLTQVRRGCGVPNEIPFLPDTQRRFADLYPNTSVMATNGLKNHDGCHFLFGGGYEDLGLFHYRKVARDLYGAGDDPNIDALNPDYAAFTNEERTEIKLVLRNTGATVHFPAAALDDFNLEGTSATLTGRSVSGHVIYFQLSEPASRGAVLDYRGHRRDSEWITNANGVGMLSFVEPVEEPAGTPRIHTHPTAVAVTEFEPATFEVNASGASLAYQWERSTDGGGSWAGISGATGPVYQIGEARRGMDGNRYRVVVSNREGTVTSEAATLSVEAGPALAPDEFELHVVGLEFAGYQFLSSGRFRADGRTGDWSYERSGWDTGELVFTYDDGGQEEVTLTFAGPNTFTIGETVIRFDRFDFFGVTAGGESHRSSVWLGEFDRSYFDHNRRRGWIAHQEHGWLYAAGNGYALGIWFWDHIQGDWLWTRAGVYPFFYSDNRGDWLYYEIGGEPDERRFYTYEEDDKGWFTVGTE